MFIQILLYNSKSCNVMSMRFFEILKYIKKLQSLYNKYKSMFFSQNLTRFINEMYKKYFHGLGYC